MKEKELKVNIPKGYEIDEENSTFECIKFKPIKKNLNYEDICKRIFRVPFYSINSYGIIKNCTLNYSIYCQGSSTNVKQLKKILAINQLFNIAKYYNGDWEPNWENMKENKYFIYVKMDEYNIQSTQLMNASVSVFKNKEDAQSVIDNPNFRHILDTIFK